MGRAWAWLSDLKFRAARAKARFLLHSAAGKKWRSLRWPIAGPGDGIEKILEQRHDVFGANRPDRVFDARARERFTEQDAEWRFQEDVIYRIEGDISIEPGHSLAYLPGRKLLEPLQGVHREVTPSLPGALMHHMLGAPAQRHDALLHFDGFLGRNLWHFFADAFNALFLADDSGLVPTDTPILIHERIWKTPLAQMVLTRPPFAQRQWVVQDEKTWIETDLLYKATCTLARFRDCYAFLDNPDKKPSRRIFLNRRAQYRRAISNIAEIEAVLADHGFETVFAEDLTFDEQVALFAQVKDVVGIHGAGLANLLFSDVPAVRCLEILPADYLNPHYYWMLQILGAGKYDAIVGSGFDSALNFRVDPIAFRQQLDRLLS